MKNVVIVERDYKHEAERWNQLGGIVVDVIGLLNHLSHAHGRNDFDNKSLDAARRNAMKVAAHALQPVLRELNDEQLRWKFHEPLGTIDTL